MNDVNVSSITEWHRLTIAASDSGDRRRSLSKQFTAPAVLLPSAARYAWMTGSGAGSADAQSRGTTSRCTTYSHTRQDWGTGTTTQ
jgi:hypothetical protein